MTLPYWLEINDFSEIFTWGTLHISSILIFILSWYKYLKGFPHPILRTFKIGGIVVILNVIWILGFIYFLGGSIIPSWISKFLIPTLSISLGWMLVTIFFISITIPIRNSFLKKNNQR